MTIGPTRYLTLGGVGLLVRPFLAPLVQYGFGFFAPVIAVAIGGGRDALTMVFPPMTRHLSSGHGFSQGL